MYRLATVTVGCAVSFSHMNSEKLNRQNFHVWNSHGQHGHKSMAIADAAFSAVRFCSYIACRMQYDRPSYGQL